MTFQQISNLIQVIKDVHKQHADDVCWMDIDRIFVAAGLPVPDRKVGDQEAMLKNCARFIPIMCQGGKWKSYVELEEEIEQLRNHVQCLLEELGQRD